MKPESTGRKIPRKWLEAAGWLLLVAVLWGSDLFVRFAERGELASGKDDFRIVTEQATSAAAALVMIPFVIRWLSIFPLKSGAWVSAVVGHTAGTAVFATGHYTLMVLLRMVVFGIAGVTYVWREPFFANLVLEYQKDIKIYAGIVAVVIAYRYFAQSAGGDPSIDPGARRLVVQSGNGETILRFDEIDYLEAARNYVAVHAGGREYLVRDTLSRLGTRLPPGEFAQSHRSYIVNLDRIRAIRGTESGHEIILQDESSVPLSRGFRGRFRERLGA